MMPGSCTIIKKACKMKRQHISNDIRKMRFLHDEMTQQQLADAVGVTRQTIVAIEKGSYSPSLELAFRMAHFFNTTLEDVFIYDPALDKIKKKKLRQIKISLLCKGLTMEGW